MTSPIARSLSKRRRLLTGALVLATGLAYGLLAAPVQAQSQTVNPKLLRIGYQKYGTLTLLKARGTLEKRLAPQGITVKWTEFPAGPQLLEGLNVGAVDFGTVGEAPPIFAQAAGAQLAYIGNEPPAPTAEAIVVPKGSALKSVADLRGKRVALNKGSNVHYLLVKQLEAAGVAYSEIQPVYLPPADARAAFERGAVDAWVIWDPFLAAAEKQLGARVLIDGRSADGKNVVSNHQFYLASRPYAQAKPDVVSTILDELAQLGQWAGKQPKDASTVLVKETGLDATVLDLAVSRFSYGAKPVTPAVLAEQQRIADAFHTLKLIPKPIQVADAAWTPPAGKAPTQQAQR
ncbi:putative aliphatic sulfonates-binding protein precursor [compost metagenome]|uniref:Putative aliphatic sulfonates-binding protein n=1 Tax=Cupriavidus campinensis TaxID=151783 RepID=A0AAE9HY77_9BURK|nr:sulfonate ABC transporter substrate-binding protein [Cupriavidus campinensis]TSP10606.1 sulfonate ABC transporter substrate-binding protein [Cupriavidus campinensis]URF02735.1 sulfonate ABC transporter substrate-binding protein [Cupriavidus campinensis]CAG2141731.1 Putative aliphatic sulfonates-binding protein [Cupriavidus campinensis]